tara:strand:- start:341 stop:1003 length:663 start_codon:yes stop_codon:yes gene_type:complete
MAKTIKITFDKKVNISAQEGDIVYFCNPTNNQGESDEIYEVGEILDISRTPFISSIKGKLSAAGVSYSSIDFYTFNNGVNNGMEIDCVVSGNPNVLAKDVFAAGTTITSVNNQGNSGTTCQTSVPALDVDGGHNYTFKLETPGETTMEIEMEDADYTSYLGNQCSPCLSVANGSFLLFSKDNDANLSSMLGYYANVQFKNHSTDPAELFTVGSEVTQSSK